MKRIPRTVCLLTAAVLLLTGCGAESAAPTTAEVTTTETTTAQAETTVTESTSGTTEAEKTTVTEGTTTTAAPVTTTTTASATAAATTSKPPVTTTKRQTTAVQTRATQTTARTTVTQKQTQKSVKVREDWCRLMDAGDYFQPVVIKDGTGYYQTDEHGEIIQFDASDIVQISSGWKLIAGLHKDGTVEVICGSSRIKKELDEWRNISCLQIYNDQIAGVRTDGTVVCATGGSPDPERWQKVCDTVSKWKNVKQCNFKGYYECTALCRDGTVRVCGSDAHTFVPYAETIKNVGTVYPCSTNLIWLRYNDGTFGTLGNNGSFRKIWDNTAYLDSKDGAVLVTIQNDGTVKYSGTGGIENIGEMTSWNSIAAISAGAHSIIARKTDGTFLLLGQAKAFEPYLN